MQLLWICLLVLAFFGAVFGTLVLLSRARRWERHEHRKKDLRDWIAVARRGKGDVFVSVRTSLRVTVCTTEPLDGTSPGPVRVLTASLDDHGSVEDLGRRALLRLRRQRPLGPPAPSDEPPSSRDQRAQLAEASAADTHAARSLRALQAHADAAAAESAAEQARLDERRAARGVVPVPVVGSNHERAVHAAP